jgi:hypothetical protein
MVWSFLVIWLDEIISRRKGAWRRLVVILAISRQNKFIQGKAFEFDQHFTCVYFEVVVLDSVRLLVDEMYCICAAPVETKARLSNLNRYF